MTPRSLAAVLRRPRLWSSAWRLIPPRWWRQWPPLPWPPRAYVGFRLQTMYGDDRSRFEPADLISYLEWCRRMRPPAR